MNEAKDEVMTCPRRMREAGPWEYKEGLDRWKNDRWEPRGNDTVVFPEGFEKPRTCSFCGCANHDDVIKLIEAGWEIEITGKRYKAYLHPPGYRAAIRSVLSGAMQGQAPAGQSPVPPVKFYSMHATQEQIDRINALHQAQLAKSQVG